MIVLKLRKKILQLKNNSLKDEFCVIWKFFYNNAFAYILLYAQNILINRYMPVELLGKFSYAQSMLILFTSVFSMEVYSAYLRFIGINNEAHLLKTVKLILCVASIIFSIAVLFYYESSFYLLFCGYMWMRERLYFFRSKLDITTYGKIKIFQYAFSIINIVLFIIFDCLNEHMLLAGIGVSYLVVSLIYNINDKAKNVTSKVDTLPKISIVEIVRYALPLSFNAIIVWLLGAADQMLIDSYLDEITLTYYSVGFRIIAVIRIGVGVIMEYWPRFYFERMQSQEFEAVKVMRKIFLVFVGVLCIGSILFSKQLYWLMGASRYGNMRWMFCLLAAAEFFRQCGSINMTFQSFMKNNLINVICLSVFGSIKLLLNWLLINEFGVSILLYTMVGCYVMYFMCSMFFGLWKERVYIKEVVAVKGGI